MLKLKKIPVILLFLASAFAAQAASLRFEGLSKPAWKEAADAATGIKEIYVVPSAAGAKLVYTPDGGASQVEVATWGSRGGAYTEPVDAGNLSVAGNEISITLDGGDTGFAFTEAGRTTYYWVVDYSGHRFQAASLSPSAEQECGRAWLDFNGSAEAIIYYGINARTWTLSRDIKLDFTTMTFDEPTFSFVTADKSEVLDAVRQQINIEAPLCDTYFTLSGDRFLRFWDEEIEVTSTRFTTNSVALEAKATQTERNADNELKVETDGLGGSGPVEITFDAAVTDAAIFREWQFSPDQDFYDITTRVQQLSFTQTFTESGTVYARFVTANNDGSCEAQSDVFSVFIGESFLRCPNAFSPGVTEGVNDEWRVSYKSIVTFECYIFNRWGQKMAEFHDPALGWDGRKGGKVVPAGVYYYVIKARGADGRDYNLSGDINILGYNEK